MLAELIRNVSLDTPYEDKVAISFSVINLAQVINRQQCFDLKYIPQQDFIYSAKTYGTIIISEMFLPYESKTIKPQQVGKQHKIFDLRK